MRYDWGHMTGMIFVFDFSQVMATKKRTSFEPFHYAFLVWIFLVALFVLWDVLTGETLTSTGLVKIAWMSAIAAVVCYFMEKRRQKREENSPQSPSENAS